jgi:hypothetical protein
MWTRVTYSGPSRNLGESVRSGRRRYRTFAFTRADIDCVGDAALSGRRAPRAGHRSVCLPAQGARAQHEGSGNLDCRLGGAFARVQRAGLVLDRSGQALEFLISYLVEYSLGVDNIFVFVLVFSYFAVPAAYQRRVLFWGILIGAGVAFAGTFHWALDLFGAFLLFTGIKMFFSRGKAVDIARNPLIRLLRSLLPVSDTYKTRASPFGTITGCC